MGDGALSRLHASAHSWLAPLVSRGLGVRCKLSQLLTVLTTIVGAPLLSVLVELRDSVMNTALLSTEMARVHDTRIGIGRSV